MNRKVDIFDLGNKFLDGEGELMDWLKALKRRRERETYLSFEYEIVINHSSGLQNLTMDQNLSPEVSGLLSEGISLFYSIWEKDRKKMPEDITKDNYPDYALDKYNPVIEYFDKAHGLDKDNNQFLEYKAHSLLLNGYFEEAIEIYRIVSKRKNDSASWNDLGVALMEYGLSLNKWHEGKLNLLGRDQLQEAIKCFDKALRINCENICSILNIASLHRSLDNYFAASVFYNRALEIDENNIAILINTAKNYLLMDFFNESKELYKRAIEIDPVLIESYFDDGATSICTAGHDDLMFLKMGLELYPDSPDINSLFLEVSMRNPSDAREIGIGIDDIFQSYNKLIELRSHDYVLLETVGMFFNYFPNYFSNDILESLDKIDLEKITETASPSDLSYYGRIVSSNGNYEEAKKFYEKSLNAIDKVLLKIKDNYYISRPDSIFQDKDNYAIRSLLEDKLSILMDIGRYEDAEKSLNQLKEYGIDESEYNRKMGIIYYKKAEKEEKKEQELKYYNKACVFFDDYLLSIPEDAYIQILRIDALSNYEEGNIVLDSIRTMINGQNLDAEYYNYLLKLAYNLKDFRLCEKIFYKATSVIEESKKKEFYEIYTQIQKDINPKREEEKQQLKKEDDEDRNTKNEIEKKQDRIEHKDKEKRRKEQKSKSSLLRIDGYQEFYEEFYEEKKKEIREIVGDKIEKYNVEFELLVKADIDLVINNIRPWEDNSEIINKFCKAIERLQCHKYSDNEGIMNEIIKFVDIDKNDYETPFKISDLEKQKWITDMQKGTFNEEKNTNDFYPPAVTNKIFIIFEKYKKNQKKISSYRYYKKWDIFAFNTIFFFYHIKKNMDENKFNLFKDIYRLYTYRTDASHKDITKKDDALRVRELVLDGLSSEEGIVKRLIALDNS